MTYRGWSINLYRKGGRGQWAGDARDTNLVWPNITVGPSGGKGAKEVVKICLLAMIDAQEDFRRSVVQ